MNAEDFSTTCNECGAELVRLAAPCWLCGAEPVAGATSSQTLNPYAPPRVDVSVPPANMLLPPFLAVVLVLVAIGLFAVAPGLGVFGTFVLVPVLARTYMVVRRRQSAGKSVSWWQKLSLFLTSFVVAYVIMTVVAFATFGAFCAACLAGAAAKAETGMVIAFVAAGIAGIGVAIGMSYWVRARYHRDINRP